MGALPTPVVVQVIVEKGRNGFGFTFSDTPQGQRVKQILDRSCCRELMVCLLCFFLYVPDLEPLKLARLNLALD